MASISLRAYDSEIENLIDRNQVEEAVAHCLHILQSVPKHIATYRLLGKALLEMQRFTDATDIFTRVLSSVPDDFVSHVGMSIIRENESNLDGAIWHMERGYEAQPANAAIQDELRRLYGRRDGMAPPKIRLTRGALARMYAKGQLYQQAIGELQAALLEDDRRPDLQVQLALMYYLSGQREQSIRVCSDLLKKLPYCYEANRILADLLPESTTSGTQSYLQRLISLDPYYAHTTPNNPTSERVPGNAVVVERLSYQPGQLQLGAAVQPDWAVSLGAPFQTSQDETLPEWVSAEGETAASFSEFEEGAREAQPDDTGIPAATDETLIGAPIPSEEIPEFLKEAGWTPSDRTADEIALEELQREQEGEISPEIEPAEIPDWLREIAPEETSSSELEIESIQAPDEEILPWLEDIEPGATDSIATWLEETKEPSSEQELHELEDALREAYAEVEGVEPEEAALAEETEILETEESEVEITSEMAQEEEALPDWIPTEEELPPEIEIPLEELTIETEVAAEQPEAEELPDWLQGLEMESSEETQELPEWLKDIEGQVEEPETPAMPADQVPAEMVEGDQPVEADQTVLWSEPEEVSQPGAETTSEDLWTLDEEELEALTSMEGETETVFDSSSGTEDISSWLESLEKEEQTEVPDEVGGLPEWLAEEEAKIETEEVSPLEDTQPTRITREVSEAVLPEMAAESEAEIEMEAEVEEPLLEAAAEVPSPSELNLEDPEAALAWLESLAAQQGAAADQLTTRPEERPETPDWILQSAAEAESRGDLPTYEPTETVEGLEKPESGLEEAVMEEEMVEEIPQAELVQETILKEPGEGEEEEPAEEAVVEEFELELDAEGLAEEPEIEEPEVEELAAELAMLEEELPEWMVEPVEEPTETLFAELAVEPEPEVEVETAAGLPDWLSETEETEELLEDTQPTVVSADAEAPPEWMLESELAEEEAAQEAETEEIEIPDWLRETVETPEVSMEEGLEAEPEVESTEPAWIGMEQPEAEPIELDLEMEEEEEEAEAQPEPLEEMERIDLNTASLAELENLPGIGFILAQSILNQREVNGPFERIEDLQDIPGIGASLVEDLRELVQIQVEPAQPVPELTPEPVLEDEETLMLARQALLKAEYDQAAGLTSELIGRDLFLGEIIQDLQDALYQNSSEIRLWENLGDAYFHNNQLPEALDAYLRAEELLG